MAPFDVCVLGPFLLRHASFDMMSLNGYFVYMPGCHETESFQRIEDDERHGVCVSNVPLI